MSETSRPSRSTFTPHGNCKFVGPATPSSQAHNLKAEKMTLPALLPYPHKRGSEAPGTRASGGGG